MIWILDVHFFKSQRVFSKESGQLDYEAVQIFQVKLQPHSSQATLHAIE
jgi:hypothetical protein